MGTDTWKNIISFISVIVAVTSFVWAIKEKQINHKLELEKVAYQKQDSVLSKELAVKSPFFRKQLDLCIEASDTAASYATAHDPDLVKIARDRFDELYHGSLVVVEDQEVAGAMVDYRSAMNNVDESALAERYTLKNHALNIGRKCRSLIAASWEIELPNIDRVP